MSMTLAVRESGAMMVQSARRMIVALLLMLTLPLVGPAHAATATRSALPLLAHGILRWPANLRVAPTVAATYLTLLPQGTALAVDAWATDGDGAAWYHGVSARGTGWIWGDAVTLDAGHPANTAALLAPLQ